MPDCVTIQTQGKKKVFHLADFEQNESLAVANDLLRKIATATDGKGQRISELSSWKGYKIWWNFYEWIFVKYCLVYSKYETLFSELTEAESVEVQIEQDSLRKLIQFYCYAYSIPCIIKNDSLNLKSLLKQMIPAVLKFLMSLLCFPFLLWYRPQYALFSSDFFSPHGKFDFRKKNIYHEFYTRNLRFVECIRTLHSPQKMISQFFKRKRPVLYLDAVATFLSQLDQVKEHFSPAWKQKGPLPFEAIVALSVVKRRYWVNKLEIFFLKTVLEAMGVRSMMIASLSPRTLNLMIACKMSKIKVVGIMHGVSMRSYVISEFMEAMDSDYDKMSNDIYGVWSEGWIDYYNRYSKVLNKDLLQVSGFLRYEPPKEMDLEKQVQHRHQSKLNVLWISEPLLDFSEAEPYLEALLANSDFHVLFKVRPNRDIVLETLQAKRQDLLAKMIVLDCPIDEAIVLADVVVGSNSTGVLDGLRYDKPIVTFKTRKWGDYFDIVGYHQIENVYSETIEDFTCYVQNAKKIPVETILKLKHFFFDIHERNGGKWIVDRMEEYTKIPKRMV